MSISIGGLRKLKPVTKEDDERLIREEKKEYFKQYRLEHQEENKDYMKKYQLDNKENLKEYNRLYGIENREKLTEQNKQYCKDNPDIGQKSLINFYAKLENKEKRKVYTKRYNRKHPGKRGRQWRNSEKGRASVAKRKRNLGYEEILPPIWGCVQHHVDDTRVIPIPAVVHQQLSGMLREEHRALVDEWMREIRPDLWLLVHL